MDLKPFETWLSERGVSIGTVAAYSGAIRRAIATLGESPTTEKLDLYAVDLPSSLRSAFRTAWRHLVEFGRERGATLPNVSSGRLGRPRIEPPERPEDFAIEYLTRAITVERLTDLRWSDVAPETAVDFVISDPPAGRLYHVHGRPLDVLLAFGRSDGRRVGAILPDERDGRLWMPSGEIEARAAKARAVLIPLDPIARFIRSLPPPRVERYQPESSRPVDPALGKA